MTYNQQILSAINLAGYDCILVDVFDTVLSRKVPGEYVKKLWADLINRTYVHAGRSEKIYKIRARVERELCLESESRGFDQEFKYNDMVTRVYEELVSQYSIKTNSRDFHSFAARIERQIEDDVLFVNQDIEEFLKRAKKNNKKVYCLSDMYLPKDILHYIFKSKNIDKYVKDIIVSSDSLLTKRSGRLYRELQNYIKISPERTLMVGDNQHVDYDNAKANGIEAVLLDRKEIFDKYSLFNSADSTLECQRRLTQIARESRTGTPFASVTFALYSFITKLSDILISNNVTDVYFLSREGEFLKVIFDKYVGQKFGLNIKSHYLLASRKATFLPSLNSLDKEDFSRLLRQYTNMSAREFLQNLNFSKDNIQKVIDDFPVDDIFDEKIDDFGNSAMIKILTRHETFKQVYDQERKAQKANLKAYLKGIGIDGKETIHIVDVGWKGTIQDNLADATCYDFVGYYFGVDTGIYKVKNMSKKIPVMFAKYSDYETSNFLSHQAGKSILEIVLGASHGSAEKYVRKKKGVEVILSNNKLEHDVYTQKIEPLQKQIAIVFNKISDALTNRLYDVNKIERLFEKIHFDLLFKPSDKEIDFFSKLSHYENFGVLAYTDFKKNTISLKKKIRKTAKYYLRRNNFTLNDYWPIYTLRSEDLNLILPVYVYVKYIKLKKRRVL